MHLQKPLLKLKLYHPPSVAIAENNLDTATAVLAKRRKKMFKKKKKKSIVDLSMVREVTE